MALSAVCLTSSCGGSDEPETRTLTLELRTEDGLVAGNNERLEDGSECDWSGRFEITDGDGNTVAAGAVSDGTAAGGFCRSITEVTVDDAEFYEVTASGEGVTGQPWSIEATTVSAEEADGPLVFAVG